VPQNCDVAARSPPLPEATTNRHARRGEQRASGLAKVVKSNLGKPGLSKHRVVYLTDEIALARDRFGIGAEYPFHPEEPSRPPLRLASCYALMENALIPPWKPDSFRLAELTGLAENSLYSLYDQASAICGFHSGSCSCCGFCPVALALELWRNVQ
jgi:hypothetical protein